MSTLLPFASSDEILQDSEAPEHAAGREESEIHLFFQLFLLFSPVENDELSKNLENIETLHEEIESSEESSPMDNRSNRS